METIPLDDSRIAEVAFEVGWAGLGDDAIELFSYSDPIRTLGARAGFRPHPRIAIVLDYQHSQDEMGFTTPSGGFNTSIDINRFGLGVKGDIRVGSWFRPYGIVEGLGVSTTARLDDDPEHDDNVTQLKEGGLSGGVYGALGAEFLISLGSLALAPYLELGYGYVAPTSFGNLGKAAFWGFSGQAGWGVRF
jgi:hypothetical protein